MRRNWVRGSLVGSGSFGTVSLAFDKSSGEVFAVKSVMLSSASATSVRSLENEIQILKSVDSPYVVSYLGDDTSREARLGSCRNLHIEYMPGGTAADLAAAKSCSVDELDVRVYARCMTRALHYLHDVAGVVHCDVKGRNVLLGRAPGAAKLADFGSAIKISGPDVDRRDQTWVRGTPLWMAPEVVRGELPTPASDVWSLGCTVIEMATGAQPWPNIRPNDTAAAMFKIGYGDELPEFPAKLSKAGRDFLDKCLRRDSTERWTAEQLLRHPYLAEATAVVEQSPRGVLDWTNSEFRDGDDGSDGDEESSSTIHSYVPDPSELNSCARERVRGLCSDGGGFVWNSEGWEVIRCAELPNWEMSGEEEECLAEQGQEQSEELSREYLNPCSMELGDWDDDGVSGVTGFFLSNGISCCYASRSHCFCYSDGFFNTCLACELGLRISEELLLIVWYMKMLLQLILVNDIKIPLSCSYLSLENIHRISMFTEYPLICTSTDLVGENIWDKKFHNCPFGCATKK